MGLLKGKSSSKRAGKGYLEINVWQRKGTFFGKKVLRKSAKSNVGRKNRKRIKYAN